MDRRTTRPGVPVGKAWDLIGVDGLVDGGLRPFPGFKDVHEFYHPGWGANHDATSEIVDLFVRTFVIGEDGYGYGFFYRVRRKNGATGATACDIFVDYYNSNLGTWIRGYSLMTSVPLPPNLDAVDGRAMSVSVHGRLVYVFVGGEVPLVFFTLRDSPWTTQVDYATGPGKRPSLLDSQDAGSLGSIITTGDASRPGAGQLFLTEFRPSETGLFASYPDADDELALLEPGDYAFAYFLLDSQTGRRSSLSVVAPARFTDFSDPDGSGPLERIAMYAALEICYDKTKYDQAYLFRSVMVQNAGGTYIAGILHLDSVITLEDYHTNNNPLADASLAQAIYWYMLEDKPLTFQKTFEDDSFYDEEPPRAAASIYYDGSMLCSGIQGSAVSTSDENRPEDAIRGIGEFRWSSLLEASPELFPPSNRFIPSLPSDSLVTMKPVGPNVVGWSRDRQYLIRKEGGYIKVQEMHDGFGAANSKAADTVGALAYFVSPKGLKAVDSLGQLDDVRGLNQILTEEWRGSLAHVSVVYDPTLSVLFVHNPVEEQTALLWFNTSKVTMLHDMTFAVCARGAWPEAFEYDHVDLVNNAGLNNDTYRNPLTERAFFVRNAAKNSDSDLVGGFAFRVCIVDHDRERVRAGGAYDGQPEGTLFQLTGDTIFEVDSSFTSGATLSLVTGGAITLSADNLWNAYVYVLKSADPSLIGKKAVIRSAPSGSSLTLLTADAPNLYGLIAGDVVGLCPVYLRWTGHPASHPVFEEIVVESPERDFFRVRHIDTIGAAFTDVSDFGTDLVPPYFRASAYLGSSETPAAIGIPRTNGADDIYSSVEEGEGVHYAALTDPSSSQMGRGRNGVDGTVICPSIEIFIPDLDYRLLGVVARGSVRSAQTTRQPTR